MAPKRKNAAAVALSKLAAKARMKKLTPEQRSEYARNAARARWAKARKKRANYFLAQKAFSRQSVLQARVSAGQTTREKAHRDNRWAVK